MSVDNLQKQGIVRSLRTDAALGQLVAWGPIAANPDLPHWVLRQLVRTRRIVRLRRGVYLVPDAEGRLVSAATAAGALAPEGYVSFYGALALHGLTDQDPTIWAVVSRRRQQPARYGLLSIQFVPWPTRLRSARVRVLKLDGRLIRVATPVQAFLDTLEAPRFGPAPSELLRVLSLGLRSRRIRVGELRARALRTRSPALAARLGLLLELATGRTDKALARLARRSHGWRELAASGREVRDTFWRLLLPTRRERLVRAAS